MECPGSGETINVSMSTPRVVQRYGQSVYFCCNGCMMGFWMDPTKFLVSPSDPMTEILVTTDVRRLAGHDGDEAKPAEPIVDSASGRDGLLAVVLAAWLAAR